MARTLKHKELNNTRLANTYGGWIYCEGCNKTIGYLCYVTYDLFRFDYKCKCGSCGRAYLAFEDESIAQTSDKPLATVKNRLCCPTDESPLVTVLVKNLKAYKYEVVCKACNTKFQEEQGL
ncbi:MAG: hypothetical protein K0Q85_1651 [Caproiciproducens sp.]|jgi:hypothetical protein|nr:hypothetical protein [Caproiciproducens sp.]